jgi:hypothetical protein
MHGYAQYCEIAMYVNAGRWSKRRFQASQPGFGRAIPPGRDNRGYRMIQLTNAALHWLVSRKNDFFRCHPLWRGFYAQQLMIDHAVRPNCERRSPIQGFLNAREF